MKKLLLTISFIALGMLCLGQSTERKTTHTVQQSIKPNLYDPGTELTLDLINGLSMPRGNFGDIARDGFNSGFVLNKKYCRNLSLGLGANYSAFNFRQGFGQVQSGGDQYRLTSLDIGPQYTFNWGRFSMKLFGRSGLTFINTPSILAYYPNSEVITTNFDKRNTTALITRLGTDLSAKLCNGLKIFVSTEYVRTLNSDFDYQTRDVSKAIRADGTIDPDQANEISFNNESFTFSGLNINFGVNINIGSSGGKSSSRKGNPIYEANPNKGVNPLYKGSVNNPLYEDKGNKGLNPLYEKSSSARSSGSKAQDYNSSRSNTTSAVETDKEDDKAEKDSTNQSGSRAQDYNSSRSNTTSAVETDQEEDKVEKDSTNQSGSRAQDYNSSRSNTTSAVETDKGDDKIEKDSTNQSGSRAQDYNSSRSNNGSSKAVQAQDYNSSRSNNSSVVDSENTNPKGKARDYNSSRSNNGSSKAVQAQDYNSSRSNNSSLVAPNDDIRESMTKVDKRKLKRKLKKERRQKLKEEKRKQKEKANKVY
jgi:hypothetical protein